VNGYSQRSPHERSDMRVGWPRMSLRSCGIHLLLEIAMGFAKAQPILRAFLHFRIEHVLLTIRPLNPILYLNGSGFLGRRRGSG
jgi:hypothetical protein